VKILLITAAGLSSRFNKSLGKECLKCIYYKDDIKQSLLYNMIYQNESFDKYIIVGGYKFDELKKTIECDFSNISRKIILIKNPYYSEYGSGYSLYEGLKAAYNLEYDELIFAEGDLFIDKDTFFKICNSTKNVITCNRELISASKAVAFYYDLQNHIHYIYDTKHKAFEINEPFLGIFNSGQIWKFTNSEKLKELTLNLPPDSWKETNLNLIQKYFGSLDDTEYETVMFKTWINCNTVEDFQEMLDIQISISSLERKV